MVLEPQEALAAAARVVKQVFPLLDDEARLAFWVNLMGESGPDKVTSMVHL
jgi:hypothetical protein